MVMLNQRRPVIFTIFSIAILSLLILHRTGWSAALRSDASGSGSPLLREIRVEDQLALAPEILANPSNYTRHLIISKRKQDDVSWVEDLVLGSEQVLYVADDQTARYHPPKNKGNEVISYLSYIIEHYDTLPDISVFMHAHRWAWHNNALLDNDAAQMLERLSDSRVIREGYMNLRCQWGPGCPHWLKPKSNEQHMNKQEQLHIGKVWKALFPTAPTPDILSQACCGQFAVSREAIRRRSLEQYERFRDWVLETELSDYVVGRCFEYLWQYIFTGRHEVCPSQHACYCDGYGICFAGEHAFQRWFEVRYNLKQRKKELEAWRRADLEWMELHDNGTWHELPESEKPVRPERGRDSELEREIQSMQEELSVQRMVAMRRGDDPRIRATESGRVWNDGDEF